MAGPARAGPGRRLRRLGLKIQAASLNDSESEPLVIMCQVSATEAPARLPEACRRSLTVAPTLLYCPGPSTGPTVTRV